MSNHPPMTDWPRTRVEALEGRVAAMDDIVRQLAHDAGLYYVATDEDIAALEGSAGDEGASSSGGVPSRVRAPAEPTHDCVETGDCRCVAVEMVAAELDAESCICPDCTDGCAGCEKLRELLKTETKRCGCILGPQYTTLKHCGGHALQRDIDLREPIRAALKTDVPAETEMCPDCSWIGAGGWAVVPHSCSTCNGSGTVPASGGDDDDQ